MYKIGIIPGDGVGPEVIREGLKVIDSASKKAGFRYETVTYDFGGERYLKTGEVLPDSALEEMKQLDAIYLGAVGHPQVKPGILERGLLLRLRFELDQYINLRPVILYPGVPTPLKDKKPEDIDFVVVRENTEGLYANKGAVLTDETAESAMVYTRKGCERIINYAFEYAKRLTHSKVTSVDKANVLNPSRLWRRIFHEIGDKYPEINKEDIYIDAFCQWLIRKPDAFQTVVTGNMFGDIISDEGAFLIGSLGMASSGNIHPGKVSMYEPIHGSAPDIAGKGIANPIGVILSVKLMMQESFQSPDIAKLIENSVEEALKEGRTIDLKNPEIKNLTTSEMGDLITEKLKANLKK